MWGLFDRYHDLQLREENKKLREVIHLQNQQIKDFVEFIKDLLQQSTELPFLKKDVVKE